MSFNFDELMNLVDGEQFVERPVEIEEFMTGEKYLNLPDTPLSDYQYQIIKASSQIYKRTTLHNLYGFDEGEKRWAQTMNEVICELGKGSGKDFVSTIACSYIVYLLLCLKDPAKYYNKPPGDTIDIINIAINATQANNVFFKGFSNRIQRSPWFVGKYISKQGHYEFDKNVNVYSGHSEREAWEGYNVIYVVLDEISGFALESTSGHEGSKTAQAVYDMYRASITSRFPDFGKLVLLSFPRFKNDFIQQRYDAVVADKKVITRSHTFKLDPDLEDGREDNEFTVEWEEDNILSYRTSRVYALKRPSWEVNPTRKIDDYIRDFFDDPVNALARFACMPPDAIDAFFKSREKIELAFNSTNGVDTDGRFAGSFQPDPDKTYYIHVDLARKHDHCSVAMAHVEKWGIRKIGEKMTEAAPLIKVDAVRWWTPTSTQNVDFIQVREYIMSLAKRGFNIKLVTFDRWESYDMMEYLNENGMPSERLSVAKKHYEDMAMVISEERVIGPNVELLREELLQLRIMKNDKVDHPRKGCFTGETRIPLLDGTRPMISELSGKEVWVYSCTPDGKIVPGRARGRMTKTTTELVDVILDSGAVVRCTPEHRWMLRTGEYREAQLLRPGIDRLMPINLVGNPQGSNHKVRDVVRVVLEEGVPVYDLEVDTYHNFALSAGVFVHNSKDLSDSVCGAIYNAIAHTPRNQNEVIEIQTLSSYNRVNPEKNSITQPRDRLGKIINPPKRDIPDDIQDWMGLRTI